MANRFGIDLMTAEDDDGNLDLVIKPNNDLLTTQDYEDSKTSVKFEGYYSIIRAILNRLNTVEGEYPFDPSYGTGIHLKVSQNREAGFEDDISLTVQEGLLQDDRVAEVVSVSTEVIANSILLVKAKIILIGDDSVSELVFPEMFI
jgi:hypothetical protein